MSMSFIGQEIGVLNYVADLRMTTVGSGKKGRIIPIVHHIFKNNKWVREKFAPQPTCWLNVRPCPKDHKDFGHEVSDKGVLHPVNESMVADTGCQSTAVPASFAYRVGFRRKDFIPVKMSMNGVEGSSIGIMGARMQVVTFSTPANCAICLRS